MKDPIKLLSGLLLIGAAWLLPATAATAETTPSNLPPAQRSQPQQLPEIPRKQLDRLLQEEQFRELEHGAEEFRAQKRREKAYAESGTIGPAASEMKTNHEREMAQAWVSSINRSSRAFVRLVQLDYWWVKDRVTGGCELEQNMFKDESVVQLWSDVLNGAIDAVSVFGANEIVAKGGSAGLVKLVELQAPKALVPVYEMARTGPAASFSAAGAPKLLAEGRPVLWPEGKPIPFKGEGVPQAAAKVLEIERQANGSWRPLKVLDAAEVERSDPKALPPFVRLMRTSAGGWSIIPESGTLAEAPKEPVTVPAQNFKVTVPASELRAPVPPPEQKVAVAAVAPDTAITTQNSRVAQVPQSGERSPKEVNRIVNKYFAAAQRIARSHSKTAAHDGVDLDALESHATMTLWELARRPNYREEEIEAYLKVAVKSRYINQLRSPQIRRSVGYEEQLSENPSSAELVTNAQLGSRAKNNAPASADFDPAYRIESKGAFSPVAKFQSRLEPAAAKAFEVWIREAADATTPSRPIVIETGILASKAEMLAEYFDRQVKHIVTNPPAKGQEQGVAEFRKALSNDLQRRVFDEVVEPQRLGRPHRPASGIADELGIERSIVTKLASRLKWQLELHTTGSMPKEKAPVKAVLSHRFKVVHQALNSDPQLLKTLEQELSPRELTVLRARFLAPKDKVPIQEEVARELNLDQASVSQTETAIYKKFSKLRPDVPLKK